MSTSLSGFQTHRLINVTTHSTRFRIRRISNQILLLCLARKASITIIDWLLTNEHGFH